MSDYEMKARAAVRVLSQIPYCRDCCEIMQRRTDTLFHCWNCNELFVVPPDWAKVYAAMDRK